MSLLALLKRRRRVRRYVSSFLFLLFVFGGVLVLGVLLDVDVDELSTPESFVGLNSPIYHCFHVRLDIC